MVRPLTGELVLTAPLDREKHSSHELTIGAQDAGVPRRESNLTLRLTVLDDNDHAPEFASESYSIMVGEDAAIMTQLLQVELAFSTKFKGSNELIVAGESRGRRRR